MILTLLIDLEGVFRSMVISSSFVIDDMYLLQLVRCWLHLHGCSDSECHNLAHAWFFGGALNSSSNMSRNVSRWYSFQLLRLDSSWWTSSSILRATWTGIRIHGMDLSKYFWVRKILWNQKSRDESKAAFSWKERRELSTLWIKQRGDRSKKVS